jgi:siroheme decarboxylase
MADTVTDNVEFKLLGLLQNGFPVTQEPFSDIGMKLAIKGDDVILHISNLKIKGIVRQISPVLDARKIGYQSTLVAMTIPEHRIGRVENFLVSHPGISHAYERDNDYNIWFTLSLPVSLDIQTELKRIYADTGAESAFDLPAVRVFKLRTNFSHDKDNLSLDKSISQNSMAERIELSEIERNVINALQEDLPLSPNPFKKFADKLGISVDSMLSVCQLLLQKGVIRRYGASINHYKAGYKANAMTCWYVPPEKMMTFVSNVTTLTQVSHCYERKTNPCWHYNVFVMIHGYNRNACRDTINKIGSENGINDMAILFSTKEFKKTRIKYPV